MPDFADLASVFGPTSPERRAPTSPDQPWPGPERRADQSAEAALDDAHRPPVDGDSPEAAGDLEMGVGSGVGPAPAAPVVPVPAELASGWRRFEHLGDHVAAVLQAAYDAGEGMKREARSQLEVRIGAVEAEIAERQRAMDDREREAEVRMSALEAKAHEDAERLAATLRAEVEADIASLVTTRDALRAQLDGLSGELRRQIDELLPVDR